MESKLIDYIGVLVFFSTSSSGTVVKSEDKTEMKADVKETKPCVAALHNLGKETKPHVAALYNLGKETKV